MSKTESCPAQKQLIEEALKSRYVCAASKNILASHLGIQNIPGTLNQTAHLTPGGTLQAASIRPRSPSPCKRKVPLDCNCGFYKFSSESDRPFRKRLPLSSEVPETVIPPPGSRQNEFFPQENRSFSNRESFSLDQQVATGSNIEKRELPEVQQKLFEKESDLQKINQLQKNQANMGSNQRMGRTEKMRLSQSGILYVLNMIREPVLEYQESRGLPRDEEITFVTLITSLCTQAYTAGITILVMLWNLMPLVDGFVYFLRFVLDKSIDILQTEDNKDRAVKGAILFAELTVIFFLIFFIIGLIFMPVYVLIARLFSKVFSMIAW